MRGRTSATRRHRRRTVDRGGPGPTRCGGRWPTGPGRACSPRRRGSPRCAGPTASPRRPGSPLDAAGAPLGGLAWVHRRRPARRQAAEPAVLATGPTRPCPTPRPGTCCSTPSTTGRRLAVHAALPRRLAGACTATRGCASSARPPGTARRWTPASTSCTGGSPASRGATSPRPRGPASRWRSATTSTAVRTMHRPARAAAQEQVPAARPAVGVLRAHLAGVRPGRAAASPCWPARGDEVVAAALFLEWDGRPLLQVRRLRSRSTCSVRPNDAIYWAAIRRGRRARARASSTGA